MKDDPYEGAAGPGAPLDPDMPIWEVKNIAQVIGRTERQTYHLLASGKLPANKVGDRYVSTRRRLLAAVLGEAV